MRRNRDRTVRLGYTWEPDQNPDNATYDLKITAIVEPSDPGDRDTPSSLGSVEFTGASLETVTTETETHRAIDEPRRDKIEQRFLAWLDAPEQILVWERLEEQARMTAEADDAGAKEEAEVRRAEARRERHDQS
ncbi:MAG: hypothetical protein WC718_17390 [Phycisphaerales bacterium]|jgi:hypothetical protein